MLVVGRVVLVDELVDRVRALRDGGQVGYEETVVVFLKEYEYLLRMRTRQ